MEVDCQRRLLDDAVVENQEARRRDHASDRREADRRQPVEKFPPGAGDRRRDHEPEFVDDAGAQQCLCDRDAGVDADVASGSALQVSHEVDQPTLDRTGVGPLVLERCGGRDVLRDRVDPSLCVRSRGSGRWTEVDTCKKQVQRQDLGSPRQPDTSVGLHIWRPTRDPQLGRSGRLAARHLNAQAGHGHRG
jgi:hypothetical protein